MRHFSIIALIIASVVLLTPLSGLAQTKFKNEDTAKNRQDNTFGTRPADDEPPITEFGVNEAGDSTVSTKPLKKEEVDWYDKVIIVVDPDVSWPKSKTSTTTTNTESTNPAGETSTSSSTTTTTQE